MLKAEHQLAFEIIVTACSMAPVLRHFYHEREVIFEPDAYDNVSAGVLSLMMIRDFYILWLISQSNINWPKATMIYLMMS